MRPLLLLHGALGAKTQLGNLTKALGTEGFVVYTLDFSGHHGEPFKTTFGIETFAEDVVEFLDRHAITDADIFGYSMGGYVALWLAVIHPMRVSRIMTLGTKFDWSISSAEKEVNKLDTEMIVVKAPAFARLLENRHAPNDWKVLTAKTTDMMRKLGAEPLLKQSMLIQITHQVLVILGDEDEMADRGYSESVASMLANGSFILMDHTRHPIEKVNVAVLAQLVKNFLNR